MRTSTILLLTLLAACGGERTIRQPTPPSGPGPQGARPTRTSTAVTGTATASDAPTALDRRACEHIYDCGLSVVDGDTALDRSHCAEFRLTDLDPHSGACAQQPTCDALRECLGVDGAPPPGPSCGDDLARALAVSRTWSGLFCVVDGAAVFDSRCLRASFRQSYFIEFAAAGRVRAEVVTAEDGRYASAFQEGNYVPGCDTMDLELCGRAATALPVRYDGELLHIGDSWVLHPGAGPNATRDANYCR